MTDQPQWASTDPGFFALCFAEARHSWQVLLEEPGRLTRYAAPWFGILFLMALPLPFLGVLDGAQRPTVSGLDFSAPAALLAISLHSALWIRCVTKQDFPGGIPLTFGLREVAVLIGYAALLGAPTWLWLQAIGLLHSMDHHFVAVHRMAGWFGASTVIGYGISEALQMATVVMLTLAIIATALSVKAALLLVDLALDRNFAFARAWKTLSLRHAAQLAMALFLAGLPFGLVAAMADHVTVYLGEDAVFIGFFEIMATFALFPLSAAMAVVLGRMARHLGYDSARLD